MKSSGQRKTRWSTRSGRWIALGTLAAYALAGGNVKAFAATTDDDADPGKDQNAAQIPVRRFDIPAGQLDQVLDGYAHATGITLHADSLKNGLAGIHSNGVRGMYSVQQALREILAGTGLSSTQDDSTNVTIAIQSNESVSVSGSFSAEITLNKFTQPLLDTPQTVDVVSQYQMQEQGISTLRDTLRSVPGISLAAGEAGAQGDNLTIRGFTARNDIFLDGIRDYGSYFRDSFNYEQVDVLEGPAGIQFGRGSTGGVVNQESKVPEAQPLLKVNAQFGTDLTRRVTADINEPLPEVASGAAFRVNIMGQDSQVAERNFAEVRRFGFAPSLSIGMNTPTRFTVSYFHISDNDTPDYGLPWLFNKVPKVPRRNYYGFPDENYLRTSDDIVTLKLDHDFKHDINVHSIARWANYPRQAQITEPQICSSVSTAATVPTLATNTNVVCPYTPTTDPSTITVNRNQIQTRSVEGELWDQTEVTMRGKFAGVRQDFVGGVEGGQEISNPIRTSYSENGGVSTNKPGTVNSVPSTNLVNPNNLDVFSGTGYISSIVHAKGESMGVYFVDTLHLGRYLEASGGMRWDYFDLGYNGYQPTILPAGASPCTTNCGAYEQVSTQATYRAALVFKPNSHGSVYFDYGTSFNPSAESFALMAATQTAPPELNETYEAGTKWNFDNGHLLFEGSVFRTEKDNARETDPTNSNNVVVAGNQFVKGMQASMVGRMPHGMDVILGYAYLDSAVIASSFFPSSIGGPLANVPVQTFNFFVTHNLPRRFNAGIGGNYVGLRTASSTTPYVPIAFTATTVTATGLKAVPGYWVFNAMLSRPLTNKLQLQANVYNMLNRFYIDLPHPSHLIPGAGFTALIGLNYKF